MFQNQPQIVTFSQPSKIEVIVVDTNEKLDALTKELAKAKVISFDTETTSTEEMKAEIVGISLAIKDGQGYYIPVGHSIGE
jgi:DNA polymerase-1